MGPDTIWIFIPLTALMIPILAISGRHRRQMVELRVRELEARAALGNTRDDARSDRLEERVRVLERIVTDRGHDLAHQIESLRDVRNEDRRLAEAGQGETLA